jgi:maltose O-acetyltransferase
MLKRLANVLFERLLALQYTPRERILRRGGKVGHGVFIGEDVLIDYDYAFLLEIGDGAVIAARSVLELHDSCIPNVLGRGKMKIGRITIGRRAYIGASAVVLPGVRIGDGAIVGAGALVSRDVPPGEVWTGVPARFHCTVAELAAKRATAPATAESRCLDWTGEPEKGPDYPAVKERFLAEVQALFARDAGDGREQA